jgi:AhpD family alkylhydroperoxidase
MQARLIQALSVQFGTTTQQGNQEAGVTEHDGKHSRLEEFRRFREKMNERILGSDNLEIKRFFALDTRAYEEGALPVKTKELMGLVASLVLRCDDCVTYHIVRCREEGVTRAEFLEAFNVGLVVGGSITIPHMRRAVAALDEIEGLS